MHHMASLGGGIAILCFEDAEQALQVSYAIRDGCVEMGLPVKIGIDSGPILLLAKQHGPSGISGDAVNIASKISEDFGVDNMVTVTDRAARTMRDIEGGVPFRVTTSQVEISGIRL
jgi:class 3 adenylate cyclase